jgi:predicted membrane protein
MSDAAFYETAAQVIPLLFLVIVFERRYFEVQTTETKPVQVIDAVIGTAEVGLFIAGEAAAIVALVRNDGGALTSSLVLAALSMELLAALFLGLDAVFRPYRDRVMRRLDKWVEEGERQAAARRAKRY